MMPPRSRAVTVRLFLTTTPVLFRNAAPLRGRAAPPVSLRADAPTLDTRSRHCSSLRRCLAAEARVLPEIRRAPAKNSSARDLAHPPACAICNQRDLCKNSLPAHRALPFVGPGSNECARCSSALRDCSRQSSSACRGSSRPAPRHLSVRAASRTARKDFRVRWHTGRVRARECSEWRRFVYRRRRQITRPHEYAVRMCHALRVVSPCLLSTTKQRHWPRCSALVPTDALSRRCKRGTHDRNRSRSTSEFFAECRACAPCRDTSRAC